MTAPFPDDAIIPARAEGILSLRWSKLAAREGHRGAVPPSPRLQQEHQSNGRQGGSIAVAKKANSSPLEKACDRAMFLARHHAPFRTRDLMDRYGMSDGYARRVLRKLEDEKKIMVIDILPTGTKIWGLRA